MTKWLKRIGILVGVLAIGPLLSVASGDVRLGQDWRTADRHSAGLAPAPAEHRPAIVQVYAARAFNWRGIFAVHTWIATKPKNGRQYKVHQVVGWRAWRGLSSVVSRTDRPDRNWYGAIPVVVGELNGHAAAKAIPKIEQAVRRYPFEYRYAAWPGPNSNSFTAFVGREVPELKMDLPVTAIGKDYLSRGRWLASAPSGTGHQISLWGAVGVLLAWEEGLELNVLGLSFGLDPSGPAVKLPGIGRLGPH